MSKRDVAQLFNKYAGKEINRKEGLCDPVLQAIRRLADENELSLRVWWPGAVGTRDFRFDRLNVYVTKSGDKHRISSFDIG